MSRGDSVMKRAIVLITTILLTATILSGCGQMNENDSSSQVNGCKNVNPINGKCEDN